nr:MAG TPA: hypothetical protein [Caudoviricetes sp.]DAH03841.1 MAG TPA: hypothetical protein [Caudoviricetes sp.]DAM04984.1 MAG TPA: hypothetical protein [Caudoviricetes sp.]
MLCRWCTGIDTTMIFHKNFKFINLGSPDL